MHYWHESSPCMLMDENPTFTGMNEMVKTHSHRTKVAAKAKIFIDVCRFFKSVFCLFFNLNFRIRFS